MAYRGCGGNVSSEKGKQSKPTEIKVKLIFLHRPSEYKGQHGAHAKGRKIAELRILPNDKEFRKRVRSLRKKLNNALWQIGAYRSPSSGCWVVPTSADISALTPIIQQTEMLRSEQAKRQRFKIKDEPELKFSKAIYITEACLPAPVLEEWLNENIEYIKGKIRATEQKLSEAEMEGNKRALCRLRYELSRWMRVLNSLEDELRRLKQRQN